MIRTWSRGVADDHMGEEILIRTAAAVRRHPWWEARARLTRALLARAGVRPPARVLDAGCGWGATLEALEAAGYRAVGLDVSRRALERLDGPGRDLVEADLSRPLVDWEGAEPGAFDAALALDVIEHMDDDRGALATLAELVAPGGTAIVSVPALPALFSEFDAIQGHRRRYEPDGLARAFEGTGLTLRSIRWWGAWMVPILRRRLGRKRALPDDDPAEVYLRHLALPPRPGPAVLRALYAIEHPLAVRGLLPTGTSLFAVARREG